jgi:hypothetical protein
MSRMVRFPRIQLSSPRVELVPEVVQQLDRTRMIPTSHELVRDQPLFDATQFNQKIRDSRALQLFSVHNCRLLAGTSLSTRSGCSPPLCCSLS